MRPGAAFGSVANRRKNRAYIRRRGQPACRRSGFQSAVHGIAAGFCRSSQSCRFIHQRRYQGERLRACLRVNESFDAVKRIADRAGQLFRPVGVVFQPSARIFTVFDAEEQFLRLRVASRL